MCGDYYIGGREFDTLSDLIGYYTSWSDLLKGERLQHPVPPPEPVYDKRKVISILPYSQIPETDELSFDKGEIFVVHNDMGDGWLWVTSQSTALSGIINQELVVEQNGNADPVEANDWFHPEITKKEAGEKLWRAGPESWLVRPSDSNKEDYTLFFYCNCQIQRFKIQKQGRQYYMGGRFFDSIVEIIERYKKEEIVEKHTLGKGVLRPRSSALTEDSNGNRNGRDIYATMRQSSGSNFFLNRKDTIIIKGYLNKKSQRTKKWKYMYFVLNGTEQQLYYFDNQKRSKPKGLIDLSYSSLYPVHDSFFGRPNCFQLILRALNQVSVYYICADNSDQAQEWTQALKPYCTNNKPKKVKSMLPSFTELRSLQLKVFDAHKLSCKHAPHPYCIVSLNDVKVCRTQVKETPDPQWDEEFMLDDIPADIESFTISIYNKGKRSKDTEVVNLKVYLSDLQVGETVDEWQSLYPANVSSRVEAAGSLRVKSRYQHEVIMPLKEYTSLKELLLAKDLETVLALSRVCRHNNDREPFAKALLQIFRHERQEAHLLRTLNDLEIDSEEITPTLFRVSTLPTTLMDQYMKMTTTSFLHAAVQSTINRIMESKQSCEINPAALENPADIDLNARHLVAILTDAVNTIFMSTDSCPSVLRYLFGCLQKRVKSKWPKEAFVKTRVVSGFLFLRLLCAAILNPKQFNLITEAPSQMAARSLKLVANCLIKLANLTEAKEAHMEVINPFIRDNQQRMVMFLDELSNVPDVPNTPDCPSADIARSLATVHQICVLHLKELQEMSYTKPFLKTLVAVTEMLTNHKKHYISNQ